MGVALESNFPLESVVYCPEILTSEFAQELLDSIETYPVAAIQVTKEVFYSFANKDSPQGIAAVGMQTFSQIMGSEISGLWIALENVQDPGNLGTILRSLDGAAGAGLFLLGDSTSPFHPTAVRSSTGALFQLPIVKMEVPEFISLKKETGIFTAGTICEKTISYRSIAYPENLVLLMGSEQKGLSRELRDNCDELITIPMGGKVDSLNLSNAASIVLFEIYAKRLEK